MASEKLARCSRRSYNDSVIQRRGSVDRQEGNQIDHHDREGDFGMNEIILSNMAKDAVMIDFLLNELADCYSRMGLVMDQFKLMSGLLDGDAEESFHDMAKMIKESVDQHREVIATMQEKDAMMQFIDENKIMLGWLGKDREPKE